MLLNNYWNLVEYTSKAIPNQNQYEGKDLGMVDPTGTAFTTLVGPSSVNTATNWSSRYGISLRIGTGTTTPQASDHNLTTDITNSMFNVQQTLNSIYSDGQLKTVMTISGTNNTGSTITITEIGVLKSVYKFVPPSSYSATSALLSHDLLNTPLTVPSGNGFNIVYEWDQG